LKLSSLIKGTPIKRLDGRSITDDDGIERLRDLNREISSLHSRAQNVKPGGLFVAIKGFAADGHDYIEQAVKKGAAAVITHKPATVPSGVLSVEVTNSRAALASLASRFYGAPSEKLMVIGITGTNGKTTTSYIIESILRQAGKTVGVVGTINYRFAGKEYANPVTTPESLDLQRILKKMLDAGVTHVVLEVSSHALDLHRIDGCFMDVAVFTNLSQDHLDYHKDMADYWACKKRLFTEVLLSGPKRDNALAIINANDPRGRELKEVKDLKRLMVGDSDGNDMWAESTEQSLYGLSGKICTPSNRFDFQSPLVGIHNVENILCAAGVGHALGIPPKVIKAGIEDLEKIPGRLEPVSNDRTRFVFVDYAHTPDALEHALTSLKTVSRKRIICVFGCGGDRDRGKRPQMGSIAVRKCDLTVVTSDNPRSEPPLQIIEEILNGTRKRSYREYVPDDLTAGFTEKGFTVEPNRRSAIYLAIAASRPGDTVLIAGKGHETYQILGDKTISFDDRLEAERALRAIKEDPETEQPT
jgi:UDP-N-acetylmuramoyl-L-alanyl-D-glutamate--2,6-diaminopimelate ligase/murE/murF fusion protein